MRRFALFLILVLLSSKLCADDKIIYSDGSSINVIVAEVGLNYVKFKKSSNPDGPLYTEGLSKIDRIIYANGSEDKWAHKSFFDKPYKCAKMTIEAQMKLSAGVSMYEYDLAEIIVCLRLNDYLRLGLGSGFGQKRFECGYSSNSIDFVPICFNIKYNILAKRFSPYLQGNIGTYIYKDNSELVNPSLLYNAAIGLDVFIGHGALFAEIGFETDDASVLNSYKEKHPNASLDHHNMGFCVGFGYQYTF